MATRGALPPGHAFGEGPAVSQARLFTVLPTHSRHGPTRLRRRHRRQFVISVPSLDVPGLADFSD
jgi:hypothetical protein